MLFSIVVNTASSQESDSDRAFKIGPRYAADGKVMRPEGWRKWVFVGAPVTPNDMNGGAASFQEFHVTYMEPEAFATFERTGKFPNGTQIVKEMVLVGSKEASSGNGYFMGDYFGLELTVKDTERYKDQPGGWAYYSFGHKKPPYNLTAEVEDAASCNSCHEGNADTDWVFTQYYPVLRAAMKKK
jgi:hypothetical protein